MLKQRWLHRKQNPLSRALAYLAWLYIYWTHTFPKSSCSLHRKLCHVVALLLKGYFALSRLLVSDFLLFNVLFWTSIKKFKVLGSQILESWVLSLRSWVPGPRSRPGSWVSSCRSWVPGSGSWVPGSESRVLGPGFQVLGSYFSLCPFKSQFVFLTWIHVFNLSFSAHLLDVHDYF